MHEVAIIEGLIDIIEKSHTKEKFKKVTLIEVVSGKYNCVSEESLTFCFEVASKNSYLEGAKLVLKRLSEKYRCVSCKKDILEEAVNKDLLVCPYCASSNLIPSLNTEIYLGKLEVE